jgi:hypothetical protein
MTPIYALQDMHLSDYAIIFQKSKKNISWVIVLKAERYYKYI